MRTRLVTFDLDDTLWHTAPVIAHAEQALQQWLARRVPQLGQVTLEHIHDWKQQVLQDMPQLAHSVSAVRYQVLLRAFLQAGEQGVRARQSAEEAFQFFLNERQRVQVHPEVRPMLERIRSNGWLVGALSNGNADVRRVGLGDCFDFALNADGLGMGKPHAAVFAAALGRAGVKATQAVHVGDNPLDDIAGALHAGWQAVWFNPQGLDWTGDNPPPSAEIRQLQQLPDLLEQLV